MDCTVHWAANVGAHSRLTGDMEAEQRRERNRRRRQRLVGYCKQAVAFLFSHIGLAGLVVAYSILGGFIFRALEAPAERITREKLKLENNKTIHDIWGIASLANDNEYNFTKEMRLYMQARQRERSLISGKMYNAHDASDDILSYVDDAEMQWSFAGALLYSVTVITTIGYGHLAPTTGWGRFVTIIYALIGIPLTFLYLSNIGNFLADSFRLFYRRMCCDIFCCQQCERKKKRERMRTKRKKELAAQRNTILGQAPDVHFTLDGSETADVLGVENGYTLAGLPGGANNGKVDFVDETDGELSKEPRIEPNDLKAAESDEVFVALPDKPDLEQTSHIDESKQQNDAGIKESQHDLPDELTENQINDLADARETAILDDDTDGSIDCLDTKKDCKYGTDKCDTPEMEWAFDQLEDARETDILGDYDDSDYEKKANDDVDCSSITQQADALDDDSDSCAETRGLLSQHKPTHPSNAQNCEKRKEKSTKDKPIKNKQNSDKKHKNNKTNNNRKAEQTADVLTNCEHHDDASSKTNDNKVKEAKNSTASSQTTKCAGNERTHLSNSEHCPAVGDATPSPCASPSPLIDRLSPQDALLADRQSPSHSQGAHKDSFKSRQKSGRKLARRSASARSKRKGSRRKRTYNSSPTTTMTRRVYGSEPTDLAARQRSDESFASAQTDLDSSSYQASLPGQAATTHKQQQHSIARNSSNVTFKQDCLSPNSSSYDMREYMELSKDTMALALIDDPFDYDDEEDESQVTVPISVCLLIIIAYIFAGSVLFTVWEEWDYLTGSYFCFITLSTIGFGDIVPGTQEKEWSNQGKLVLCSLWLAFGLSLLAMCFNLMQEEVKEKCKWVGHKLGLLKREDDA